MMNRIAIIGSGGSGKSTFARKLGEILGIEVIHLDAHFWSPGWVETPRDRWAAMVESFTRAQRWIIDGNYSGTMDIRLAAADTIIFLDLPRTLCLARALRRAVAGRLGSPRPDISSGCPERFDPEFLNWIWRYPLDRRPAILTCIDRHRPGRQIHILRSPGQVRQFLEWIERSTTAGFPK